MTIHSHTFSRVEINFLASAGRFGLAVLDFGAYLASKTRCHLRHHVVHRVKFGFVDIESCCFCWLEWSLSIYCIGHLWIEVHHWMPNCFFDRIVYLDPQMAQKKRWHFLWKMPFFATFRRLARQLRHKIDRMRKKKVARILSIITNYLLLDLTVITDRENLIHGY